MVAQNGFAERFFRAQDDLPIYYRDYGSPLAHATPVLCLNGLTRNSRDFHAVAQRLSRDRRVLCMDYRGRGRSGYDGDWRNYRPETYARDAIHLLTVANVHHVVIIGTSLGGLIAMALGALIPAALAGVVLNDIGPEVAAAGRARIGGYVGAAVNLPDYESAVAHLKRQFGRAFPGMSDERWFEYARATFTEDKTAGGVRLNYDLNLGRALRAQAREPLRNLWPLYHSLRRLPVLAIRGTLSDVLDQPTFDRMADNMPNLVRVALDYRGHVPLLEEPECTDAIDRFLARV